MKYASSDLIHEHDAILLSLKILDEISDRVNSGIEVPSGDIIELIDFLKLFADKCHHGKEEGIYFPMLEKAGIPRENGPIGVMLAEHQSGRGFIAKMQESVEGKSIDKEKFFESTQGYINLLRAHIEKENKVLFPMGDSKISESKQSEILDAFEEFEKKVIGEGKHDELHKMLNNFKERYLKRK